MRLNCEYVDHCVGVAEPVCSHIVDVLKLSLVRLVRHVLISCTERPHSTQHTLAYPHFNLCDKSERKWTNSCRNDMVQLSASVFSLGDVLNNMILQVTSGFIVMCLFERYLWVYMDKRRVVPSGLQDAYTLNPEFSGSALN